jgi:hypothetical protein
LQTKDSNDKKQKWAITMESITNVGAAGRGIRFGTDFRSYYNNNNSHDEVCLYRQVTDAEGIMLTVGAISYATLYYSNQAFVVPTNVKVHTYKYQDNTLMVSKTYAPGQTIPAGTAVVVAAQPGSYPFLYSSETGDGDAANMLRGFDEAATATAPEGNASDYYFYMLSLNKDSDPGSAGFYFGSRCTNGEPFTSGAHKAYLALPKSQANQARSFLLSTIPTGINKLTSLLRTWNPGQFSVVFLEGDFISAPGFLLDEMAELLQGGDVDVDSAGHQAVLLQESDEGSEVLIVKGHGCL